MAGKNEWTRNRGKRPVGSDVLVEVRFRHGTVATGIASALRWSIYGKGHEIGESDIMAWRRVRAPRKPRLLVAIAPEHAPRPAVPEAKPAPEIMTLEELQADFVAAHASADYDAPRRPRIMDAVLAIIAAVGLIAAVCYVF